MDVGVGRCVRAARVWTFSRGYAIMFVMYVKADVWEVALWIGKYLPLENA